MAAAPTRAGVLEGLLRVARRWWLPPLLCGVVSVAMLVGTPAFGPPDSPVNLATAWYDIHHGFPDNALVNLVPGPDSGTRPCYTYWPNRNVDCHTDRSVTDIFRPGYRITNYPPVYLWILGIGELAAHSHSPARVADGARVIGLLACLALLFLSAWMLSRRRQGTAIWSIYLLSTPLALYMYAGANPNAWEICSAFLLASTLVCRRDELLEGRPRWSDMLTVGIAALLLTTARPSGTVWLICIMGCFAVWTGAWRRLGRLVVLATATVPAALVGLVWNALHPLVVRLGAPTYTITLGNALSRIAASSTDIVTRFTQIWGTLGWNDTVPSAFAIFAVFLLVVYYLPTIAPTRRHRVLLVALLALVFVTASVWQAVSWQPAPMSTWWRMRYSLPLAVGVGMLLFAGPGDGGRRGTLSLAAWVTALNAYMVCVNLWRYDYGITNGFPAQLAHAGYGVARPALVYAVAAVLVTVAVGLFAAERARRSGSDAEALPALRIV